MLRTNLSTRPFYNERLVHALLAALAVVIVAITVINLWGAFTLSGRLARLQARAADSDARTAALRRDTARMRGTTTPQELDAISADVREVNAIIDRRAFSWTELFNRFEETLPDNVRIASVSPRIEKDGALIVTVVVLARNVEGVDTFMESLERQGAFSSLLSREEFINDSGLLQAKLEGRYLPAAAGSARKGATP